MSSSMALHSKGFDGLTAPQRITQQTSTARNNRMQYNPPALYIGSLKFAYLVHSTSSKIDDSNIHSNSK